MSEPALPSVSKTDVAFLAAGLAAGAAFALYTDVPSMAVAAVVFVAFAAKQFYDS